MDDSLVDSSRITIGEYVVYGTNGVCMVEDIKMMRFALDTEKNPYCILKPAGNESSTIYVPLNNEKLMSKVRPVMTKEEIDSLLLGMRDKEIVWDGDRRNRTERFHDILLNGVTQKLLLMIRCIYMKKQELMSVGKSLSTTDDNTLKSAEKLVEEEFSHALDIPRDDVSGYIRSLLEIEPANEKGSTKTECGR